MYDQFYMVGVGGDTRYKELPNIIISYQEIRGFYMKIYYITAWKEKYAM